MTHTRSFKTHENKGDLHIDLVMSPPCYAGHIGNIEVNAVGSGSASYNLERSDGACCEFEADLRTDSDNDGDIDEADDAIEDDPNQPGRVFAVNSDDDNNNGIADFDETGVAGEDDLAEIRLSTTCPPVDPDSVTWSLSWPEPDGPYLRIWDNPNKASCAFAGPIENAVSYPWPPPSNAWIESLQTHSTSITFTASTAATRAVSSDWVHYSATCTPGNPRYYVRVIKQGSHITRCSAKITTRNVALCSEYYDPGNRAVSAAYVAIRNQGIRRNSAWLQTGFWRARSAAGDYFPDANVRWHIYTEVKGVGSLGIDKNFLSAPEDGNHEYTCQVNTVTGKCTFTYDLIDWYAPTLLSMTDSVFNPKQAHWAAEVLNKEDRMVGTAPLQECTFSECQYNDGSTLFDQPFNAGDAKSTDLREWGADVTSPSAFIVWDKYP